MEWFKGKAERVGAKRRETGEEQECYYYPGIMSLNIIFHWLEAAIALLNIDEYEVG